MKRLLLCCAILLNAVFFSHSQTTLRELFSDAEFDLLYNAYEEALPKFLQVLESDPGNSNYNFRVGLCFLNISGRKKEAIPYLQIAVMNTTMDYEEGSFKESNAPLEAYLYLGNAYKSNDQMEHAKDAFAMFINLADPRDVERIDYAHQQIEACSTAEIFKDTPIDCIAKNLGNNINDSYSNYCPAVSGDMSTLAFTTRTEDGTELIFICKKGVQGDWAYSKNITEIIGSEGNCHTTDLNYDGTKLLVVWQDNFDSDIMISEFINGQWTKIEKLNNNINSKYWESHASFSPDDKTLYFTSNRKGGIGGIDIYKSELNEKGEWGPALNVGEPVNTPFHEETPFLASNNTLYYSSQGNNNMGGFDIFYSVYTPSGVWDLPMNVGYPINTTDDDLAFVPIDEGIFAYHSKVAPEGFGGLDIYHYEIFSEEHPHYIDVMGNVKLVEGPVVEPDQLNITIQDKISGDVLAVMQPNENGNFMYTLNPGKYSVVFNAPGYEQKVEDVILPTGYDSPDYLLFASLEETKTAPLNIADNTSAVPHISGMGADDYAGAASYTIQIRALRNYKDPEIFDNLEEVKVFEGEDGLYRYIYGEFYESEAARRKLREVKTKGYRDAFINSMHRYYKTQKADTGPVAIAAKPANNDIDGFTIQVMALRRLIDLDYFKDLEGVKVSEGDDGFYRYTFSEFSSVAEAKQKLVEVQQRGYPNAFIRKLSSISNY